MLSIIYKTIFINIIIVIALSITNLGDKLNKQTDKWKKANKKDIRVALIDAWGCITVYSLFIGVVLYVIFY